MGGKTIAEKVLSDRSTSDCHAGDIVVAAVDYCMAQDGTSKLMIEELENLGFERARTKSGMAVVLDHSAPSPSAEVSRIHGEIRRFSKECEVELHDVGEGVCHQVIPESGKIRPGDLVVGADSHTCTYGALNLCSTGLGSADVAAAAFTGKLWFRVPETYRVNISGSVGERTGPKDLILTLIGMMGADGATYKSIEFVGDAIRTIGMDGRMTMANMVVEMGAKFGPFQFDDVTADWYDSIGMKIDNGVESDADAVYEREVDIDASDVVPKVAAPHRVDNVRDVADCEGIEVNQAFLGTCTNGRLSDLMSAAKILKGKRVHENVRFIVAPASRRILAEAVRSGAFGTLIESGAIVVAPGCGPCVGTHAGVPSDGDNVISTANRNFMGRMGNNSNVSIYLASPETVVASALNGHITDPRGL
ncbi:MAG: 3-isopropylmalate dehydratase large subunit [Methanobacteriota archaeon]|nr:MAG: 3-isopropylmalate dehydratase large subunit [Euryarchaeota archaeon]